MSNYLAGGEGEVADLAEDGAGRSEAGRLADTEDWVMR